jgi:hypothetical protein
MELVYLLGSKRRRVLCNVIAYHHGWCRVVPLPRAGRVLHLRHQRLRQELGRHGETAEAIMIFKMRRVMILEMRGFE